MNNKVTRLDLKAQLPIYFFLWWSRGWGALKCKPTHKAFILGGYKVRKEPSLAKRCEKSEKDAKSDKFREITGIAM